MENKETPHTKAKSPGSLIGAVLAAMAASVCCLGPLVLVALGLGGAWAGHLSAFQRYRPLFMLMTFGFLAFAFYKAYFKSRAGNCATDGSCANPGAGKINKIALWGVTALVTVMLVAPGIIGAFESNSLAPVPSVPTKRVLLNVEGMTCAACAVTVTKSLERVDGVYKANVTMTPPEAVVVYDPAKVTTKQLTEATKNAGYPASVRKGN